MQRSNLLSALTSLNEGGIDFILVGGLAAVLNGAPVQTYDVDIVFSRHPENVGRLLRWLESVDAIFRLQPERRLRPNESHLSRGRHLNLITEYGPVDLLATVGEDLGFEELLPNSIEMAIGEGKRIRVLNLATIIALKEALGGEKDLAVLPILRRTLQEIGKQPPR